MLRSASILNPPFLERAIADCFKSPTAYFLFSLLCCFGFGHLMFPLPRRRVLHPEQQRNLSGDVIEIHISARGVPQTLLGTLETLPFRGRHCPARGALVLARSCLSQNSRVRRRPLRAWGSSPDRPPPGSATGPPTKAPLTRAGAGCLHHSLFTIFKPLSLRTFTELFDAVVTSGEPWVLHFLCRVACRSCASHVSRLPGRCLPTAWVLDSTLRACGHAHQAPSSPSSPSSPKPRSPTHHNHIPITSHHQRDGSGVGRARQRSHRASSDSSPRSLRYPSHVNPDSEVPLLFPSHSPSSPRE